MTGDEAGVALITGAGTINGIGHAIGHALLRRGLRIIVTDVSFKPSHVAALEDLKKEFGLDSIRWLEADLNNSKVAADLVEEAWSQYGKVDYVINNAALRDPCKVLDATEEIFDEIFRVNLRAPVFIALAAAQKMSKSGGGRILNVGSQFGRVVGDDVFFYGMSKAAILYATRALAEQFAAANVQINSISPGPIATNPLGDRGVRNIGDLFTAPVEHQRTVKLENWNQDKAALLPSGKIGTAEEIARVAEFILLDAPDFMIGADLLIDGGYVLR